MLLGETEERKEREIWGKDNKVRRRQENEQGSIRINIMKV